MRCTVSNFRGIHTATIQASPIALLCGHNGQGKSSIIEALAALFDGNQKPYGLTKDGLERLIFRGEDAGTVEVKGEGRGMTVNWPSGDVSTEGAPFRATKCATGSMIYANLDERARMQVLAEYLKTAPSKDELKAALTKEVELDNDAVDRIWAVIQKFGWDGAFEHFKTEGAKLKGAWTQITKATYGSKVGATWRPQNWTDDHEATTEEELKTDKAAAEKALEDAIGKVAINADEKAKHQALSNNIPKLKQLVETREADGKRAKATLEKAENDLRKIPVVPAENWPNCPHCKTPLQVLGADQIRIAPAPMDAKERKRLEDAASQATTVLNQAQEAYQAARNSYDTAKKDLETAETSRLALEASDEGVVSASTIQEHRDEITRCDSILGAKKRIRDALHAHMAVKQMVTVVGMLDSNGLRKTKLLEKLEAFNQSLAGLCEIAGWEPVTVLENGTLRYGQTSYDMCSGGERMRCDVTIQIAFGERDGSEVYLIDEADILDGPGRNGLFALLGHTGKHAIIGMMLLNRKNAPDLEKAGIGKTYWIEEAESHDIAA